MNAEQARLEEARARKAHRKRWGPYLSERAWDTVREDYTPGGTAWECLPHDHGRSKAYLWNGDGIEDILVRIRIANRGPEAATLHLLPTIWFRNTWSWDPSETRPRLRAADRAGRRRIIELDEPYYGKRWLHCEGAPELLFAGNETHMEWLHCVPNPCSYVKDGINDRIVQGDRGTVNPEQVGTKAAAHYLVAKLLQQSGEAPARSNGVME